MENKPKSEKRIFFLDELRGWWGFGDKGERAVFVDGNFYRDDVAAHGFGLGVVGLDELHHVDTVLTKCWANWWSR